MKRSMIWKIAGGIILVLVVGVLLWNVGLHVHAVDAPITAQPSDCAGAAPGIKVYAKQVEKLDADVPELQDAANMPVRS